MEQIGRILLDEAQIAKIIEQLAGEIKRTYADIQPVLVGILNGSLFFMADLIRVLDNSNVDWTCVYASSYEQGVESSGDVRISIPGTAKLCDKHLLLVEDIVDTGFTIHSLLVHLRPYNPLSVRVCTLLDKPSRRKVDAQVDFCGFTVGNEFVVGYGLDYRGKYRNLPYVAVLNFTGP